MFHAKFLVKIVGHKRSLTVSLPSVSCREIFEEKLVKTLVYKLSEGIFPCIDLPLRYKVKDTKLSSRNFYLIATDV